MKLKTRKVYVWCTQEAIPFSINDHSHVYNYKKYGNKFRTKHRKPIKDVKIPSKVKCPLCKKRFKPRVRQCHDIGCWHFYVPPHKKYIKIGDVP